MNLKSSVQYQLYSKGKAMLMYYSIYFAIIACFVGIFFATKVSGGSINNMEFSSSIFIFVIGLNSLKGDLKFFLANGLTRRNLFISVLLSGVFLAIAMTLLDYVSGMMISKLMNYVSFGNSLYPLLYPGHASILALVYVASFYFLALMIGFTITNTYYLLNKLGKLLLSILVPITLLFILPLVDGMFFNRKLLSNIWERVVAAIGIYPTNQPMIAVTTFLGLSVILAGCSYLMLRRATIKEH